MYILGGKTTKETLWHSLKSIPQAQKTLFSVPHFFKTLGHLLLKMI